MRNCEGSACSNQFWDIPFWVKSHSWTAIIHFTSIIPSEVMVKKLLQDASAEKASQFHIRVPNGHGDRSLDKPGVWLSGWSGLFGGRFQDSNYGDRKSPRPGVVEPLPNGRTPWLEKMAVILTTYCKCVFFFGRQHNPPWNWGSLEYWCLLGTRTCPCLFDGVEGSTGQLKLDWLVTSAHENLRGPHQIRISSRNKALLRGYCPPWFVDNPLVI